MAMLLKVESQYDLGGRFMNFLNMNRNSLLARSPIKRVRILTFLIVLCISMFWPIRQIRASEATTTDQPSTRPVDENDLERLKGIRIETNEQNCPASIRFHMRCTVKN